MKKKVAVLGGGIGSLSAVFGLTSQPGWQDRYDITVYQMGWRLGGKCASGRRPPYNRIEEHGLHIWIGFYDNAFRMIQAAYAEMNRPEGAPIRTWTDALKPHDFIVVEEFYNGTWRQIPIHFPRNDLVPGDAAPHPGLSDYVKMAMEAAHDFLGGVLRERSLDHEASAKRGLLEGILHEIGELFGFVKRVEEGLLLSAFGAVVATLAAMSVEEIARSERHREGLMGLLEHAADALRDELLHLVGNDDRLRDAFVAVDLGLAVLKGLIRDGVFEHPDQLDKLDDIEFRDWLLKHGADRISVYSGSIRALYDLAFGYVNGDPDQPDMAAGVALRSAIRIGFGYKGAIFWKMQAGMGDIVLTPLYDVLRKRGVKFAFFHKVENLGLNSDQSAIETIRIGVQAHAKAGEYMPLVDVKGLPSWPSDPIYDLLVEGDALRASGANLESHWTEWQNPETKVLRLGEDFDEVVLGIPVGAHPFVCSELIAAKTEWAAMTREVKTTRTLAMQLWLSKDLGELGWSGDSPVMDGYAQRFNTWADMSQLIPAESFPEGQVRNVAYYCGPMSGGIPDVSDKGFPARALVEVQQQGLAWLNSNSGRLWPNAAPAAAMEGFDFSLLVDPANGTREERFFSQYQRVNIDPSERYVLSVTGSTRYRLAPGNSGFANLFLAGDWTENQFNVGCVEATVMSGLLCSNAMCGYPPKSEIAGLEHA